MKPEELKNLVAQSESDEVEFKSHLPDTKHLAVLISAFANTKGGRLIIGVQDDGSTVGLKDVNRAYLRIEQALKVVSPSVEVITEDIVIDGKSVFVVTVPKGSKTPYLVTGRAFHRRGAQIVPITSQVIYSGITERTTSNDDLRIEIKRLSRVIETQNQMIIAGSSWKTKIPEMVVGGIIGAVISSFLF